MYIKRRKGLRDTGLVIDTVNVLVGIAVIIIGIFIFTDIHGNAKLFPVLFALAGIMNMMLGIKYLLSKARFKGWNLIITAILLFVIAVVGYMAAWR